MDIEEEKDLENTVNLVLKHASDTNAQKTSLSAALRLFYSRGYTGCIVMLASLNLLKTRYNL